MNIFQIFNRSKTTKALSEKHCTQNQPIATKVQETNWLTSQFNEPSNNDRELIKLDEPELAFMDNAETVILGYIEFGENLEIYGTKV